MRVCFLRDDRHWLKDPVAQGSGFDYLCVVAALWYVKLCTLMTVN